MPMPLERLLTDTPLATARPEVLVPATQPVSWVHSSEIYEIAPLLDGGEVLLTTGLGLVGADDDALVRYAEGIAARHAAALVLELGRTFVHPPTPLVDACARTGLGLVVLHEVVPFARIARVGNELLLDHEASVLRAANRLAQRLADDLRHRAGIGAMVDTVAEVVGAPVQLVDLDGRVHAGPRSLPAPTVYRDVQLSTGPWGRLVAHDTDDDRLPVLLERGADAIQVAVAGIRGVRAHDAAGTLLLDIVRGAFLDAQDVTRRAAALGVPVDRPVTALVAVPARELTPPVADAITRAIRTSARPDLLAVDEDRVLAVVDAGATRRAEASRVLTAVDAELARLDGGTLRCLAVGTAAATLTRVADAFGVALLAASTAQRMRSRHRLLLAADVALDRLLLEAEDASLERFVERVLGPLLEHDATHRTDLLPTLVAYLAAGRSKARAADGLAVRRQTVHERLDRVVGLLDMREDDPLAWTSLEVAVRAWRIRTAAAGRS